MSTLLARALEAADLDLLLLGALADKLRAAQRGEVVRLFIETPTDEVRTFDTADDAHTFLRTIAISRLSGDGAIRVDARGIGLQLAQVALTFGADEIIASVREENGKRSLEVYGGDDVNAREKEVLRERELVGLIRSAGRVARVVDRNGERDPDETTHAVRKFRAPGREARGEV
jgi:hypothetical protein